MMQRFVVPIVIGALAAAIGVAIPLEQQPAFGTEASSWPCSLCFLARRALTSHPTLSRSTVFARLFPTAVGSPLLKKRKANTCDDILQSTDGEGEEDEASVTPQKRSYVKDEG
jgi:hypothetical protein